MTKSLQSKMATKKNALTAVDRRSFFEQALAFGIENEILTENTLEKIRMDGGKGLVQIANFFGTAHLMANLESAALRMINLISLFLESQSASDLRRAAISLRDQSLLSHSKGGSDMLKRLNAMPSSTFLFAHSVSAEEEKTFLNERSYALPMTVTEYQKAVDSRQQIKSTIDFAKWAARQMHADLNDYEIYSAEELIYSALLVWYAGKTSDTYPTEAGFVRLLTDMRKTSFKPSLKNVEQALSTAPDKLRDLAAGMMQNFVQNVLPIVHSNLIKPVEFIRGDHIGIFCFRTDVDDDSGELDKLVSKEWVRLTKGQQEQETIATIFLLVATGQAPKASLLKKEAVRLITQFRETGFNSEWVLAFIDSHVPHQEQEELIAQWEEDILPDAQLYLSDPTNNDTHMDRALEHIRQTCSAKWKGR